MTPGRGAIWIFPEISAHEYVEGRGRFTFAHPADVQHQRRALCLVGLGDEDAEGDAAQVQYVALQTRGGKITSLERCITLDRFHAFQPLSLGKLKAALPKPLRRYLGLGPVAARTWSGCLEALRSLRPEAGVGIDMLRASLEIPAWARGGAGEVVAQERDAVRLALAFTGMRLRDPVPVVATPEAAPFLSGVDGYRVREDQLIQNDASVFGDWRQLRRHQVGVVEFSDGAGGRLTVMNVNRTPVESTLGVDLLYYTHCHGAYVLVQYKMLRPEGDEFVFRPSSDGSFEDEVRRMSQVDRADWKGDPGAYRLDSEACFFKFCKNVVPSSFSSGLIEGLYVPLRFWDALTTSGGLRGPRGGIVVSQRTLPRYLSATDFKSLVEHGWVGSRGPITSYITQVVRLSLEASHSLVLASFSSGS